MNNLVVFEYIDVCNKFYIFVGKVFIDINIVNYEFAITVNAVGKFNASLNSVIALDYFYGVVGS